MCNDTFSSSGRLVCIGIVTPDCLYAIVGMERHLEVGVLSCHFFACPIVYFVLHNDVIIKWRAE